MTGRKKVTRFIAAPDMGRVRRRQVPNRNSRDQPGLAAFSIKKHGNMRLTA
jgi:hypothetical protein